jgi:dienelactone hydrolase
MAPLPTWPMELCENVEVTDMRPVFRFTRCLVLAFLAVAASEPCFAQDRLIPPKGDGLVEGYLHRDVELLGRNELDGATSIADWKARRPRLERELYEMLGLWPVPERTPLNARVTGTLERDGGVVIEKLHFQSRPGLYVTGNLYRPRDPRGKLPAILYVCGHTPRGRDGNKTAFQDHGMWFARNGYVALLIDTLQLGEIAGVHHGTYNLGRWWWQALGYTPAGVECWNGIRSIDYLVSRPDVDPARIGVTGISGGGATTFWIAAADVRVACAVPVSGMSDLESYVEHRIVNEHCDCMFVDNAYRWEWTTLAAMIAPRPMLFANSDQDPMFPMDGNTRVIDRLRKVYALHGHPGLIADHVSPGGHEYRGDLRIAVFRWMNRHLKQDSGPVSDADDPPIDGKRLRVFPEDSKLPRDAKNGRIDESFVTRASVIPPAPEEFDRWKGDLLARLRKTSFRTFPDRIPAARVRILEQAGTITRWLETEPGIEVTITDRRPAGQVPAEATLFVQNEEEKSPEPWKGIPEVMVVLSPRGVGPTGWVRKSPPNYVERSHVLVGKSVDGGRVWDVAATVRFLAEGSGGRTRWTLAGRGKAGVIAAYAALFEPSAEKVVMINPPDSHLDGPIFLSVLRVLDVPDAAGLLAPRPLTLIDAKGDAFERTRDLYRRAGAPAKLVTE